MLRLIAIIIISMVVMTDPCLAQGQKNRVDSHKKSTLMNKHKNKSDKRRKTNKKNQFNEMQQDNQRLITQRSAIAIATQHYPGRVLRAVLSRQGHPVYRVKIVNAGRVRTIEVDAYTGNIR